MKKLVTIVMVMFAMLASMAAHAEIYPGVFCVLSVDQDTDTMMLIDANENLWEVSGVEDYDEGDCVGAIMDDNGTEDIADDMILSIRYCGWFDGDFCR